MIIVIPRTVKQLGVLLVAGVILFGWFVYQDYEALQGLRHFETQGELERFLQADRTDEIPWTTNFVCEDFARTLIKKASLKGYYIETYYITDGSRLRRMRYEISGDDGHALCIAFVVEEGRWVMVEPQTDVVFSQSCGSSNLYLKIIGLLDIAKIGG